MTRPDTQPEKGTPRVSAVEHEVAGILARNAWKAGGGKGSWFWGNRVYGNVGGIGFGACLSDAQIAELTGPTAGEKALASANDRIAELERERDEAQKRARDLDATLRHHDSVADAFRTSGEHWKKAAESAAARADHLAAENAELRAGGTPQSSPLS